MDRTIEKGEYRFSEGRHLHELLKDGEYKALTGVTTVLGIIAKPALIQWSANMAVEYIKENVEYGINDSADDLWTKLEPICEEAKKAHTKKKEKAGDWGTETHSIIERYVNHCIEQKDGFAHQPSVIAKDDRVQKFIEWAIENKVKFLESEKHVYSKVLWIGGILDLVLEMNGKRYIADIKTSSGIYDEHFFQMAAYDLCLEEMQDEKVDGYLVINLRKDGKFDLKLAENMQINKDAFLAALTLYKIKNSLK